MAVAYNPQENKAFRLNDAGEWEATKLARNPETGEAFALDGSEWKAIQVPKPETAGTDKGYFAGLTGQATRGALFGFADEVEAAGRSVGDWIADKITGQEKAKPYGEHLTQARKEQADFADQNPIAATAAQIVGGVGTAGQLAVRGVGQAKRAAELPQAVKNLLAMNPKAGALAVNASLGAAEGAAYGFGEGEGGFVNRLENAAEGAAVGGIAGATAPLAIGLVGKGVGAAVKPLTRRMGDAPAEFAERKMLEALSADGFTPETAAKALKSMGRNSMIADLGPNSVDLARTVTSKPGEALTLGAKVLGERQKGLNRNMVEEVRKGTGAEGDFFGVLGQKMEERARVASDLYTKAQAETPIFQSPALKELVENSADIQAALRQARRLPEYKGLPDLEWSMVDKAYKYIGDKATAAKIAGKGEAARDLNRLRVKLRDAIVSENPTYAQALENFSTRTNSLQAMELGKRFLNGDIEATASELATMSQGDKSFFLEGVYKALADKIEGRPLTGDAGKLFSTLAMRERLRTAFGSKEAAEEVLRQARLVSRKTNTFRRALQGSDTARIQAGQAAEGIDPADAATLAFDVASGGKTAALRGLYAKIRDAGKQVPAAERREIAEMLFSTNPKVQQKALDRLKGMERSITIDAEARRALGRMSAAEIGGLLQMMEEED